VIGDDVRIGAFCEIEDSVIDKGCVIKGHFCALSEESKIEVDWQLYSVKVGAMIRGRL